MKLEKESLFMSSLRAFFGFFFGTLGFLLSLTLGIFLLIGILTLSHEDGFSSKIKILPDADGNRKELSSSSPVLLQINFKGEIGKDSITASKIQNILLSSHEDEFKHDRIKGILLVINSPGGGVNQSDQIYRLIKNYKEKYKVPVYAFIDGMCASGGYYIACSADKIYASDTSLIGSIGVISWPPFLNFYDALEKLGVDSLTLFAGKGKDEMNPLRPWQPDEQKMYQNIINFYYNSFLQIVTESRPQLNKEKLEKVIGAEVFPAQEAFKVGFTDGASYERDQVVKELAQAASLDSQKYQVICFKTKSWWKNVFKFSSQSPLLTGQLKHEWTLPQQLQVEQGNPFKYIFIHETKTLHP